jgi:hypothetical protein
VDLAAGSLIACVERVPKPLNEFLDPPFIFFAAGRLRRFLVIA